MYEFFESLSSIFKIMNPLYMFYLKMMMDTLIGELLSIRNKRTNTIFNLYEYD